MLLDVDTFLTSLMFNNLIPPRDVETFVSCEYAKSDSYTCFFYAVLSYVRRVSFGKSYVTAILCSHLDRCICVLLDHIPSMPLSYKATYTANLLTGMIPY